MNIYVGNLDQEVTEEELKEAFESYGEVSSVKIIKDKFSGESRGFGFIEMPDNTKALNAMNELTGTEFNGRAIRLSEARPRSDNRRGGGRGGRPGGGGRPRYR